MLISPRHLSGRRPAGSAKAGINSGRSPSGRTFYENDIFGWAVWTVEAWKRGPIFVIEELLYVQSTSEQIISMLVALRCVEALGIRKRKKNEGAGSEIKRFKVLILKSLHS